jgi:TRAP-type mannitol/chloroaromatic compound transport system permease large subunit
LIILADVLGVPVGDLQVGKWPPLLPH